MEGAAAGFLFDTLKSVVQSYIHQQQEQSRVISDARDHVEQLENDIRFLKEFLEESIKRCENENLIMRDLLRKVRNCIYDAEDAIDSFLVDGIGKPKAKLAEIAQLVEESIRKKVTPLRDSVEVHINSRTHTESAQSAEYKTPPRKPKYVVGFMDKEKEITDRLTKCTQHLDVIFVTGMHGVGKTTLVAKVFHDPEIRKNFTIAPIWVRASNSTTKHILVDILRQLDELPQDASQRGDEDLAILVASCLEGRKFLIVMDDVGEIDNTNTLMTAFERSDGNSKILITSNNNETARLMGRDNPSVELEPMRLEESWDLLQYLVFGNVGCPPELEMNGRLIAEQCDGLPKTIEIVAGILARKDPRKYEMNERLKIWKNVCGSMKTYFNDQGGSNILSSYNNLDSHLRPCFLYMGIFPERSKFSVSKLIRMWIAEGFVRGNVNLSLEETAHDYLKSLTDRNLVIVDDRKPDGSAKTCSMNYLMYEFCKTEAGNERENFLEEVKKSTTDGVFHPSVDEVEKYRRICIHADFSRFISKFVSLRGQGSLHVRLRSFISHSEETCPLKKKDVSVIGAAFKLLRVLDAKPMGFTKFPGDLYRLVHLRYVTLSLKGPVLTKDVSKLRNIQTLVVHTTSPSLKIEADILKMTELRHVKTNVSATLPKTDKKCEDGEQLQTLCGVSPKSCTEIFFDKARNLKKLGIRGQLALLLDGRKGLLTKLVKVEKLKLQNDVTGSNSKGKLFCLPQLSEFPPNMLQNDVAGSNSKGKLFCLPQYSEFPPNMTSLTLSATHLGWDQIKILGSLHNLKELKLKDNAFVGDKWEFSKDDAGLPHLQALHIERMNFVQWKASSGHLAKLRKLELSNSKLMALPLELAGIVNLNKLQLSNCTISANASAERIRDTKKKNGSFLDLYISSS